MKSIVTVGVSPCWDVVCSGSGIDWGCHSVVSQDRKVAGKAFNVSRALAWMREQSIAAGLWGELDFAEMAAAVVESLAGFVDVRFTKAAGRTRDNFTVVDQDGGREMHLRLVSKLATAESLGGLENDLRGMVNADSVFVFAGSMPVGGLLGGVVSIVESVKNCGAKIVVDTSGEALRKIVALGGIEILKPNLDELCELVGVDIEDDAEVIAKAAGKLLDKANIVVVTRGAKGAIVVTKDRMLQGRCVSENKIISTVGCGDYFLGGFLCGGGLEESLAMGLKAAAARAWGWGEKCNWDDVEAKIEVEVLPL